jgi:lipopolysaccharide transport system ATP-binding protein
LKPILEIKNISKRYRIRHENRPYESLRDTVADLFKGKKTASKEDFFALQDVDLTIMPGESIGIIGKNGAGKSTLLKILSRITPPTSGSIKVRGSLSSLLEVGTGFHPELSGRENVFLNGAILGIPKSEIKKHFDEIIAFSGVEKFIDTSLKHYSSGMQLRLAFAVSVHLEPDILIIDEVLAVGDAEFQRKCIGKMNEVGKFGRTLLVVSHQLSLIRQLSAKVLYLKNGKVEKFGSTGEVLNLYTQSLSDSQSGTSTIDETKGEPYFKLKGFSVLDIKGNSIDAVDCFEEKLTVHISVEILKQDSGLCLGYQLFNEMGDSLVLTFHTDDFDEQKTILKQGMHTLTGTLDISQLNEGKYQVYFIAGLHSVKMFYSHEHEVLSARFDIVGLKSRSPYWQKRRHTLMSPDVIWNIE